MKEKERWRIVEVYIGIHRKGRDGDGIAKVERMDRK